MESKESTALALLQGVFLHAKRPICLCSFGKDSIVALHLSLRIQKIQVMCWKLSKFQEKHAQANLVSELWDLEVYDTWPISTFEYVNQEYFEVFHVYGMGCDASGKVGVGVMATGIKPYNGEERFLCAVDDLLERPRIPIASWPWDVSVSGHKNVDDIDIGDATTIRYPVYQLGGTIQACPLHDWTDDDVWGYIKRYNLPYDVSRYDEGRKAASPDSYPTCWACLDPSTQGETVWCQKSERMIMNRARTQEAMDADMAYLKQSATYCEIQGDERTTPHLTHV